MPEMNESDDVLNELKSNWSEEMKTAGSNALPEGKAAFLCVNAFLSRSKGESKRPQITFSGTIVEHEEPSGVGCPAFITFGVDSPKSLKWLNTMLINIGLDPVITPDDIKTVLAKTPGMAWNVSIVDNQDPQFAPNIYVNRNARREDLETGVSGGANKSTEDEVF